MLKSLNVRNFALVQELDIEFRPGLTVITGESGAGKSILLDALSLVLGGRAARSMIRPNARSMEVSAEFDIGTRMELAAILEAQALTEDIKDEEAKDEDTNDGIASGTFLVRRTAGQDGRSRGFVNGSPVTLAVIERLTTPLVDIHGQDQHRDLLEPDSQRRFLDEYGIDETLRRDVAAAYDHYKSIADALAQAEREHDSNRERRDLLAYQVDELEVLGEDLDQFETLFAEHKRRTKAVDILAAANDAITDLDDAAMPALSRILAAIERIDDSHPQLDAALELGSGARVHLEELADALRRYFNEIPQDELGTQDIEMRLSTLHDAARKHRVEAADLGSHLETLRRELDALSDNEERLAELRTEQAKAEDDYRTLAGRLSEQRRAAAVPFADEVGETMQQLGLAGATLQVSLEPTDASEHPAPTRNGLERIEYLVTTNPNYPAGRLREIASGGEFSRIALAVQVVAANRSALPCLILDEADLGVGGTTADVLGRLLRRVAKNTQVIAITHAPQIAALGDTHLLVTKTSDSDTTISVLDDEARVEELARMLSGRTLSDESRNYARTLLAQAG